MAVKMTPSEACEFLRQEILKPPSNIDDDEDEDEGAVEGEGESKDRLPQQGFMPMMLRCLEVVRTEVNKPECNLLDARERTQLDKAVMLCDKTPLAECPPAKFALLGKKADEYLSLLRDTEELAVQPSTVRDALECWPGPSDGDGGDDEADDEF